MVYVSLQLTPCKTEYKFDQTINKKFYSYRKHRFFNTRKTQINDKLIFERGCHLLIYLSLVFQK